MPQLFTIIFFPIEPLFIESKRIETICHTQNLVPWTQFIFKSNNIKFGVCEMRTNFSIISWVVLSPVWTKLKITVRELNDIKCFWDIHQFFSFFFFLHWLKLKNNFFFACLLQLFFMRIHIYFCLLVEYNKLCKFKKWLCVFSLQIISFLLKCLFDYRHWVRKNTKVLQMAVIPLNQKNMLLPQGQNLNLIRLMKNLKWWCREMFSLMETELVYDLCSVKML